MGNEEIDITYVNPDDTFFDEVSEIGGMMVDAVLPSPLFIYHENKKANQVFVSYMMEPQDVVVNHGKKINLGLVNEAFCFNIPTENFNKRFKEIRSKHKNVCVMNRDLKLSPWLSIDAYYKETGKQVNTGFPEGVKETGMLRVKDGLYLSNDDFLSRANNSPVFEYPEVSALPSSSMKAVYKDFANRSDPNRVRVRDEPLNPSDCCF